MIINRAFCVELQRIVDIYEARYCYFRQAPATRKRFNFLCSDKKCREHDQGGEVRRTKVTGVNYDKLAEEGAHHLRPHFRSNTPHSPNCEWMDPQTTCGGGRSDGHNPNREIPAKSSNVVDIFLPDTAVAAGLVGGGADDSTGQTTETWTETDIIEGSKIPRTRNPNRTTFLENVVDSYLFLSPDQKRSTDLRIGHAPWRSYRQCFRPVKFYGRGGPHKNFIFFGNIWGGKVGSTFSLFFCDRPEFRGKTCGVELRIEENDLSRYQHGGYLAELLAEVIRRPEPSICYFYGILQPSDAKTVDPLRVRIATFGNLVLKLKSKQRK